MKKGISAFAFGKGQKRGTRLMASTALTAAGLMALTSPAFAIDPNALPTGAKVVSGSVTNSSSGNTYTSDQHSSRAVVDFTSMNLGSNGTWNINQKNASDRFVGRDRNGDMLPSVIDGAVNAKGQVFFLNNNGVIFGKNAKLDVGSIIASTGDLDEDSFLNSDKVNFSNFGDGSIVNEGQISVADAGLVAFVGKHVANNGVINAKVGKVALAAGDTRATLDLYGDGLVEFAVDGAKGKVLASNSGTINAEGGTVAITANAAKDVVDNVINMSGVVNVSSVTVKGGKIILGGGKAGTVKVSGKMTASGEKGGGDVKITGKNVHVTEDAVITSNAGETGNGGNTLIYGDDYTVFSGLLASKGGTVSGDGGHAEISAGKGVGYYGLVDTSANDGKTGSLLIDPEYLTISKSSFSGDPLYFLSLTALGSVNINDQALANTLRVSNVNLWATKKLTVTEDIDLSTWEQKNYTYSFPFCIFGCAAPSTYGITDKNLTVAAPTVDINGDVVLGKGQFNIYDMAAGTSVLGFGILNVPAGGIKVDTVNLDGVFKRRTTVGVAATDDALDSQINSNAETINVKSDSAKIQQAVYLSDDNTDLTTINVGTGTYAESVTVAGNHGNIVIKGAKHGVAGNDVTRDSVTGETIVDPNSPGFLITADNVTLDGLVVTGATEDGIVVDGAENVTIKNSIIHDVIGDGVFAKFADGLKVFSNLIYDLTSPTDNKGSGVHVQNSADAVVGGVNDADANFIYDTGWDGVRLFETTDATVQKNDIDNVGRTGIYSGAASGSKILGNYIDKSVRFGINVDDGSDVTVTGNHIFDTGIYGVRLFSLSGTNLVDYNHVDSTGSDGIYAFDVAGLTIDGNLIGTHSVGPNINGDGIYGEFVDGAVIKKNTIQNTTNPEPDRGSGVHIQKSTGVTVGGPTLADANLISNMGWDGVRLFKTTDATVQFNDIKTVGRTGVYAGDTTGSKIFDNKIDGVVRFGVNADDGSDVTISRNNIDNTGIYGVRLFSLVGTNLVDANHIDNTGNDGIHAFDVAGLTIDGNFIGTDGPADNINGDGIFGDLVSGAVIKKNTITETTNPEWNRGSGVHIWNSDSVIVGGSDISDANKISNMGWDGVRLWQVTNTAVQNNDIDNVARTGIYSGFGFGNNQIIDNLITGAGRYGINYDNGSDATISGNDIDNTGLHGIWIHDVSGTNTVSFNHIDTTLNSDPIWGGTGGDGVHADTVSDLTVHGNFIGTDGGNINGDGIFGIRVDGAVITANEITGTNIPEWNKGSGVHIQSSDSVRIGGVAEGDENTIYETGWDGVRLFETTNTTVQNNDIDDVGRTGVYSGYGLNNYILGNNIDGTGRYGINYDHGAQALIQDNIVNDTGLHGIQLIDVTPSGSYTGGSLVSGNHVDNVHGVDLVYGGTGGDGIHAENIFGLNIYGNFIGLNGPIAENGIFVDPSNGVQITANQVNNSGHNGIYSLNNDDAYIAYNTVANSGWNGILAEGGMNVTIGDYDGTEGEDNGNHVSNSGINGIEVDGTTGYIAIRNNAVTNSGTDGANGTDGDGIQVHGVYGEVEEVEPDYYDKVVSLLESYANSTIEIVNNIVDTAKEDGIDVHDVRGTVYIAGNNVTTVGYNEIDFEKALDYSGHDGIFVANVYSNSAPVIWTRAAVEPSGSYDIQIVNNNIDTTEDDGIEVIDSGRTLIQGNTIFDVGQNATYSEVDGYGADGIHVRNVFRNDDGPILEFLVLEGEDAAPFGPYSLPAITNSAVDILDNHVNVSRENPNVFTGNTADDGIQVLYSGNTVIDSNRVANSGFVGGDEPSEEPSEGIFLRVAEVEGSIQNKDQWGADGIHVLLSNPYSEAKVSIVEEGPYYYGYGDSADITNNFVDNSADDGIDADYVHYLTVDTNDVDVSGNQGIEIVGSGYGYPMDYAFDDEPEVDEPLAKLLGLFPGNDWTAIVTNNIVNNSGKNGIKIKDYDYIEASDNTVSNSGKSGLLVTGSYNGNVNVEGNTFTDNKTGATFRSGLIDLTGRSNTFNNGQVGLKFSPIETYITIGDSEGPGVFLGRSFLQLVDDDASGVQPASDDAPISNFGGTIGAQIFNNQSLYFVELKNGAFYKPGSPTWLNGVNSTYTIGGTTITPSSNALTPAEWAFLEPMFRDWNDGGLVGRFWGQAISQASIDQQNIFEYFDPLAALGGEVNVVMLGLPRLTNAPGAGPAPFNPNAIEPAAGGDEGPTQTASLSPEELNNIQTAAGDDASSASCWSDASAGAAGGVTTISFSSVINQTTLAQDASCGQ